MSGDESEQRVRFDLAEFITDWSELFAVLGVFTGLAVSIPRLFEGPPTEMPEILQGGLWGSLGIALLIGYLICRKAYGKFESYSQFVLSLFHPMNLPAITFFLVFGLVLQSLLNYLLGFSIITFYFLNAVSSILGLSLFIYTFYYLFHSILEGQSNKIYLLITNSISLIGIWASNILITKLKIHFTFISVREFSIHEPFSMFPVMFKSLVVAINIMFLISLVLHLIFALLSSIAWIPQTALRSINSSDS